MTTKTITITDDAYGILSRLKENEESFSEEINRLLGTKNDIMRFAGAWSRMDEKESDTIKSIIMKMRKESGAHLRRRLQ